MNTLRYARNKDADGLIKLIDTQILNKEMWRIAAPMILSNISIRIAVPDQQVLFIVAA